MQKMEKGNELKHFQERGLREEKRNNMLINVKTNNKAITLIALIITVIILLILAGVALNLALRRKRNI